MSHRGMRCVLASAAVLALVTPAAAVTIDSFGSPLPPNPGLPVSGWELLFAGTMCDAGPTGGSCPPGLIVNHPTGDSAVQSGLAGVLGGNRQAVLTRSGTTGNSDAGIYEGVLCHNHGSFGRSILELSYGLPADLNADLSVGFATAIKMTLVDGDLYAGPRPVLVTVTVTSRRGTAQEATAALTVSMVNVGEYTFPFTGFSGVDFADVDRIVCSFDAATMVGSGGAVDYCVGPLGTNEQSVSVTRGTWSGVKGLYH